MSYGQNVAWMKVYFDNSSFPCLNAMFLMSLGAAKTISTHNTQGLSSNTFLHQCWDFSAFLEHSAICPINICHWCGSATFRGHVESPCWAPDWWRAHASDTQSRQASTQLPFIFYPFWDWSTPNSQELQLASSPLWDNQSFWQPAESWDNILTPSAVFYLCHCWSSLPFPAHPPSCIWHSCCKGGPRHLCC